MPFPTYEVGIDWGNDGAFDSFPYTFPINFGYANHDDNVTSDVMRMTFSHGRDSELQRATGGSCEITLNNDSQKYSPANSGSALTGNLVPNRPVRVRATFAAGSVTDEPLWYGFIESIVPHPHHTQHTCVIRCIDGFDYLNRADVDTELFASDTTGNIIGELLDDAIWSSTLRNLDAGQDTVPLARWHDSKALAAIQTLESTELGFFYIDAQGRAAFEDRHHRLKSPHTASQATLDDTMTTLTYEYNARSVFNNVRASYTEYELQATAELWRLSETPSIPAGETRTWIAEFDDFSTNIVTPVATTDYTANSASGGGGTDMTGDINVTFTPLAQSAELQLENTASVPAFITLLKVRGDAYTKGDVTIREATDSTSQTAYHLRTKSLDGQFLNDIDQAQDYADFVLARFKDPQPEVSMTLTNKDNTLLTEILTRKVSDRITVDNDELAMVNQDFYINKVEHTVLGKEQLHRVVYRLAEVDEEEFWTLDISTLGTATRLAY
tara:strand:+ start:22602 stop:24095 length:1494 start_codon:yes stop_codon:yes gene_type:complete